MFHVCVRWRLTVSLKELLNHQRYHMCLYWAASKVVLHYNDTNTCALQAPCRSVQKALIRRGKNGRILKEFRGNAWIKIQRVGAGSCTVLCLQDTVMYCSLADPIHFTIKRKREKRPEKGQEYSLCNYLFSDTEIRECMEPEFPPNVYFCQHNWEI